MHRHLTYLSLLIPLSFFVFCDVNCQPAQAQENLGINKVSSFKVLKTKDGVELATITKKNIPRPIIQFLPGENGSTVLVADFPGLIWELPTKSVGAETFGTTSSITSLRAGRFQDSPPICRISISSRNSAVLRGIAFKTTPGRLLLKIPHSGLSGNPPIFAPPLGKITTQKAGIAPPLSTMDPHLAVNQGPTGLALDPEVISQHSTDNGSAKNGAPLPGYPVLAPKIKGKTKNPVKAPPRSPSAAPVIAQADKKAAEETETEKPPESTSVGKLWSKWKNKTAKLLLPEQDNSTLSRADETALGGEKVVDSGNVQNPPSVAFDGQKFVISGLKSSAKQLKYSSFRLADPDRFVIDIENLPEISESIKPELSDNKFIKDIRFGSNQITTEESSQTKGRIVFDLLDPNTGFNINADTDKLSISISSLSSLPGFAGSAGLSPTSIAELKGKIIVLDAGHGGTDPGAQRGNNNEKDITLAVVKNLSELLKSQGIKVILTRSDDTFISLADRVDITNKSRPDAFVSVHVNAMESSNEISGLETYYQTEQSQDLAGDIHKNLLETLQIPDRNIRKAKFYVINRTEVPSVLAEIGFISNPDERERLISSDYQKQVAEGLAKGIILYLSSDSAQKETAFGTSSEKTKFVNGKTSQSPKKDSRTVKAENEKIGTGNLSSLSHLARKGLGIGMGLNKDQAHR